MNIFPPHEQSLSPFQFYADMRHNNPIAYDDRNNIWGVFRYYDVQFILGDYMHFSSAVPPTKVNDLSKEVNEEEDQKMPFSRPSLLKSDPPYHRTLTAVVASAFTPMTISKLEPRIESITHDLLNQVIEKGNMDLINDLAYPLPVTVIAELLGVPLQDRDTFRTWADKLVSSAGSQLNAEEHGSAKNLISIQREMDDYFNAIIDKRRITSQTDLISNLIKAEADGHHLSREEILAFCTLLLLAGHVTTVNLIGNTILSLLQNPQEFKKLKEDRTSLSSLIPSTIEETLRYRSPVQAVFRMTTQEITIGGAQKIPSGQGIVVWLGSANHDESVFPDPEKFDISRIPHAHYHVGFGHGIHFCLGAPLARLEARVALKIILERLQNLELDDSNIEAIKPLHSLFFHGVSQLPLRFTHGNLVKADEDQQHGRI
jgi:cytochrome P450